MEGSRVLVIDDSTTLQKLVEIALRGTGCNVDFAPNGSEGVSRARTHPPDVILLDYLLPDLRGPEVCQRLRDDSATSGVPVVVMSADERGVLDDFRTFSSVVGFIGKPFTAAEIRARLERFVRRKPSGTAPPPNGHAPATREPEALQLRGDLAGTPLLDVLRLLAAAHATGTLVIEGAAAVTIWLRRGEIRVCAGADLGPSDAGLTPELRERVTRGLAAGKPALVTLAEAGAVRTGDLPLELHAASARIVGELLDARAGRFTWQAVAALPDFVEAFGRHVSLTAIALEHSRRAAPRAADLLDHIYDRSPRFSDKLAGARLDLEEQRVLTLVDGHTAGRDIVARARLTPDECAAILGRLCAADLIQRRPAPRTATRTLAVLDSDGDELAAALRARLGHLQPIDVIELDPAGSLAAATLDARPAVVLVGVAALSRHVLEHELPIIARDTTTAVVGVLESPNPPLAAQLLGAGLHAVLAKPLHVTEIERLLSS